MDFILVFFSWFAFKFVTQVNEVLLEVTQIGKECHHGCEIMKQVGSCIMPTQGIFGKVLKNGTINIGDEVSIIK